MKLKTLRTGLVLAAVMLLLCVSAFAATFPKTWQELKTALEKNEDVTLNTNIVINDPSMFNYDENGVIISAKEGAIEWDPVQNYTGTLNGGTKFYITGLYVPEENAVDGMSGLIANASDATFQNVKIDFSLVEATEYAGLVAGKAENCTFTFNMTSGSVMGETTQVQNTAGGIVGYFGAGCKMDKSVSYATVSGANSYSSNIGGLVGYNAGTISNSASDAKVAASAKYYDAAVGGIAGSNAGTIQNCTSQATVKGETTSDVNDIYVGGIAGLNNGKITQVKNTGAVSVEKIITSSDSIAAAGGVVGMMVDVDMNNVSNEGTVSGAYSYNGGIVGVAISTDGKHTLSNAKNTGAVDTTYGINGGVAGRAVAGGEGYVSTVMHFENCEASTILYGEEGKVESAQVTGTLGTATITAPTTRVITTIVADNPQFITSGGTPNASCEGITISSAMNTYKTNDGKVVIRYTAQVGNASTASTVPLTPNPVMITAIEVTDLNAMEILSVDRSSLTLANGKLNGKVVIKVYNPDNNATAITVLGTSVDSQFVNAKFGTITADKLSVIEVAFNNVAVNTTGTTANLNVMVVDSKDNMAPLCKNFEA